MIYLYLFFKYYPTQNMFRKFPKIENKIQIFLFQLQKSEIDCEVSWWGLHSGGVRGVSGLYLSDIFVRI